MAMTAVHASRRLTRPASFLAARPAAQPVRSLFELWGSRPSTPLADAYEARVASGTIQADPAQRAIVTALEPKLQSLANHRWVEPRPELDALLHKVPMIRRSTWRAPKGVYLYGKRRPPPPPPHDHGHDHHRRPPPPLPPPPSR